MKPRMRGSLGDKQKHTRHNLRVGEREDKLPERGDRLFFGKSTKLSTIWLTSKRDREKRGRGK